MFGYNLVALICLFFLFLTAQKLDAYRFSCLGKCECDTDDLAIHCHNADFEHIPLPKSKLRGFEVIALTRNNIKVLPSQDLLFEKFPDLKAIDVEGNSDFDCSTLEQYSKITILSDCDKSPEELAKERAKMPTTAKPNRDCDFACQSERRARELHAYILHLWEMIKEKVRQVSKQTGLDKLYGDVQKFVNDDVGGFFSDLGDKITNFKF